MGARGDGTLGRWLGVGALVALAACRPEPRAERNAAPVPVPATVLPTAEAAVPPSPPEHDGERPALTASLPASGQPGAAPAVSAKPAGPGRYAFDFEDADLPSLVKVVGGITGKRFVLTGKLPAVHATVHSPTPVTADEAYEAFLTILQANGLTVVRAGPFWKILPSPGFP